MPSWPRSWPPGPDQRAARTHVRRYTRPAMAARTSATTTSAAKKPAARRTSTADDPQIVVRGAREHNLQERQRRAAARPAHRVHRAVRARASRRLAFDTIYAEGQRRYVESLSARTPASSSARWTSPTSTSSRACRRRSRSTRSRRQPQPALDRRHDHRGLRLPAAAVRPHRRAALPERRHAARSARRRSRSSTASSSCPRAPASRCWRRSCAAARASTTRCSQDLSGQGFVRARIDGETVDIDEFLKRDERLARYEQHTIEVVVDRLVRREGIERRLTDSLETALRLAEGVAEVEIVPARGRGPSRETLTFSQHLACPVCGTSYDELGAPQLLVQLAVRRVRALRRARHPLRGRPRAGRARPRPVARRRRDRAVARGQHAVLHPHARVGRRGARHRHRHAVGAAHGQAAEGHPLRRGQGQGDRQVQEPLRAAARRTRPSTRA